MAKQSAMLRIAQSIAREAIAEQTKSRLCLGFDAAIIAAHNTFQMGARRSAQFAEEYNNAMNWLSELYVVDADKNRDEKLTYAKAKRDDLIRSIVGEENFVPFDLCYGEAYEDELKKIKALNRK